MAIINCPECRKEISDKATTCPNCGCPIQSDDNLMLELDGVTDKVELYKNRIIIKKKNALSKRVFKGAKTIFLDKITGIQVRHANAVISGYIHFSVIGGTEDVNINQAIQDENSIMFRKSQNEIADKMKSLIVNGKI